MRDGDRIAEPVLRAGGRRRVRQGERGLDAKGSPPDGLIFHSAGELEGVFQVFNIWESREHFDRFREERLIPAMKEAMGEEMVAQMPEADYLEVKIHDYQIP